MEILVGLLVAAAITGLLVVLRQMSLAMGALLVIIAGIVIGHSFWNLNIGPIPLTIDRLLWVWMIVCLAGLTILRRTDPKPLNRVDLLVIALGVLLVAGTLAHDWRYKDNLPLARLLFFNLLPMGFYFVARHCRLPSAQLYPIFAVLALFGLYLGVVSIAEQQGWHALVVPGFMLEPVNFEFAGRARGPFLNPVSLGLWLTVCLAATAGLWRVVHPPTRMALIAIAAVILAAGFLTLTRSVWFGFALTVGLACWLPAHPQLRGALVVAGTVVLVCTAALFADKFNRFQRDKHVTEAEMAESASLRPLLAHVAVRMFRDKPVFGHGFGQYTAAKKPYHYNETADLPLRKVLPYMQHNVFLSYLTESGLTGLALLVALLAAATWKAWLLWNDRRRSPEQRWFGVIMLGFIGNYVINGMFHDVSIIAHTGALWYFLLGIQENIASTPPVGLIRASSTTPANRLAA